MEKNNQVKYRTDDSIVKSKSGFDNLIAHTNLFTKTTVKQTEDMENERRDFINFFY